jgi:hypothetical protein
MNNFEIRGDKLVRRIRLDTHTYGAENVITREEFVACYNAWIANQSKSDESLLKE